MRQCLLEALLLIAAAAILGFGYTFVTKQGFFVKTQPVQSAPASNIEVISLAAAKEIVKQPKFHPPPPALAVLT